MREKAKIKLAKAFRKSMSKPEVWLWAKIKGDHDGVVFRRQHAIGSYILDFYCVKAKLCVEVDGANHTFASPIQKDLSRDQWLIGQDILTYRIPAKDILENLDEIAEGVINIARSRVTCL